MSRPVRFDIRERKGILAAVILVWLAANLAAYFLIVRPRLARVEGLGEKGRAHAETLRSRREKVEALREDYNRVVDSQRSVETFYEEVLSTKRHRMTAVQKEVRDIAARFNIRPESITYSREIFENDQIVRFSAILPLTGSYENLRAFLASIEVSKNFLLIGSVALADSKEGGVILGLNVTVSTYFVDPDFLLEIASGRKG